MNKRKQPNKIPYCRLLYSAVSFYSWFSATLNIFLIILFPVFHVLKHKPSIIALHYIHNPQRMKIDDDCTNLFQNSLNRIINYIILKLYFMSDLIFNIDIVTFLKF